MSIFKRFLWEKNSQKYKRKNHRIDRSHPKINQFIHLFLSLSGIYGLVHISHENDSIHVSSCISPYPIC